MNIMAQGKSILALERAEISCMSGLKHQSERMICETSKPFGGRELEEAR